MSAAPLGRVPRAVLDTNVVISALLFAGGGTARLRHAWQAGRLLPLLSTATAQELMRVLAYPKFKLTAADQQELLADYLPWAEVCRCLTRLRVCPLAATRTTCPFCTWLPPAAPTCW